tara:strand:- start:1451 stop:1603 length:153 start_codon:yes stop_codon:yes gene_type:complete
MVKSRHFRRKNGLLPIRKASPKKKNWALARKLMDNYSLPEEDEKNTKPDE